MAYATVTYNDPLAREVDRRLDARLNDADLYKSALMEILNSKAKKEVVTGAYLEWLTRSGDQGGVANFDVYGTGDGYTAVEPDDVLTLTSNLKNYGKAIKLSKLKLKDASGPEAKADYAMIQTESAIRAVIQDVNRDLHTADPASDSKQIWGLAGTIEYDGNVYGIARSNSRALVGNRLDATNTSTSTGAVTGSTVTNESTSVTLGSSQTWNAGDIVYITDDSGLRRWYFAAAAGSASTSLTLSSKYKGATDTSVSVEIVSPFNDTRYGSSGAFDLAKINLGISLSQDGNDVPNLYVTDSIIHGYWQDEILTTERSVAKDELKRLGASNATGFMYRDGVVTVDNNQTGRIAGLNTDYWTMKCGKGYDKVQLSEDGFVREASVTANAFQNMIGEIVYRAELACSGINRNFLLTNISK